MRRLRSISKETEGQIGLEDDLSQILAAHPIDFSVEVLDAQLARRWNETKFGVSQILKQ